MEICVPPFVDVFIISHTFVILPIWVFYVTKNLLKFFGGIHFWYFSMEKTMSQDDDI